jgi:hypothetical protein
VVDPENTGGVFGFTAGVDVVWVGAPRGSIERGWFTVGIEETSVRLGTAVLEFTVDGSDARPATVVAGVPAFLRVCGESEAESAGA